MIYNKYLGMCKSCKRSVAPYAGFLIRTGNGWEIKHEVCPVVERKDIKPFLGQASQPVQKPETIVCLRCDKHRPYEEFEAGRSKTCRTCRVGA